MSPINWNDDNDVGNELIDRQHREWVRIFNQLEDCIINPTSEPNLSRLDLLKEILDFTREHFLEEERLMAQYDYPESVDHRRMHKDFEQELYEKFRMVMAGEMVLKSELLAIIRHWFIHHTGSEDKRTFRYINSICGKD